MQHFNAGNYPLINIRKYLYIQCTAVARELCGENRSAVCDLDGHGTRLLFNEALTTCKNSSVWARLTDERVARDIMRFVCGVYLTNHSREA